MEFIRSSNKVYVYNDKETNWGYSSNVFIKDSMAWNEQFAERVECSDVAINALSQLLSF